MNGDLNVTGDSRVLTAALPFYRRISWGAVIAGLLIGLATNFALSLLGVGIGATTVDAREGNVPGQGIGIGAGVWMLITSLIGTFVGARLAANLSGAARKADGALHGMLTWALATIIMGLFLTGTLGMVAGGAMNAIGQTAGAQTHAKIQRGESWMGGTAETYGQQTGAGAAQAQPGPTREQVRTASDTAAKATAQAAFWSFVLLALTAIVAGFAGATARRRDQTTYSAAPA